MKTKLENGARTPEVIYNELKRIGKLEGIVQSSQASLIYQYYTLPDIDKDSAFEVLLIRDDIISVRRFPKASLNYLIPSRYKEDSIPSEADFKIGDF